MEPNQIKDADILDILFEDRNKEYGAYELRKTYNRRIAKALIVTGSMVGVLFIGSAPAGHGKGVDRVAPAVTDVDLLNVKEPDKPLPPPPPPLKLPAPPQVKTKMFTPPVVVRDDQVKPDEKPPIQDDLTNVRIGTVNNDNGVDDAGIVTPPVGSAAGVISKPKPDDDEGKIFMKVEVPSSYPGGLEAWKRFLNRVLRMPDAAAEIQASGMVMVQFIVDTDGNVSDVEAIDGPLHGGLREEAVRVIRKSGKWLPAQQNGRFVKSYKKQPIIFQFVDQ